MGPNPTLSNSHEQIGEIWNQDQQLSKRASHGHGHPGKETPANPAAVSKDGITISSYSQIWKFPSYRKTLFHNAVDYMRAKRTDDGIGPGLWRVHDRLYDLRPFARLHPGGQEWITMTEGTDITEAFETSHVVSSGTVKRVLEKYYVRGVGPDHPRNSPFTFAEGGFYKTLQARVEPVLKSAQVGGSGPRWEVVFLQDVLAFTFLVLTCVSTHLDSIWLQFLAGLVLAWTIVCAHNFFHIKDNWRKYYFDLSLVSSYEWRLGHALSHHLYPNTVLDYEVYLMEPWTELGAAKRRNWVQKYMAHFYLYVVYSQFFGMELTKRIVAVFIRRVQRPRPENFLPLIWLLVNMYLSPSVGRGVLATFIMHSVASFYFSFVGSAMAAHHHPNSFHEGDIPRSRDGDGDQTDFGLCQLDVVKESTEEYNHNVLFACVTFGEHPLHHLFPTVCHSKLRYLQPAVNSVLEEFREEIQALSSFEKYTGIHRQLNRQDVHDFRKNTHHATRDLLNFSE